MILSNIKAALASAQSAIITGLAVFALTAPVAYCKGESAASSKYEAARALANEKALRLEKETGDTAAAERIIDALRINQSEEELIDAIADTPDTVPDPVRVRLGCERLRAQGTPAANIPAECGPGSGYGG